MEFLIKVQNHNIQKILNSGLDASLNKWSSNYSVSALYRKGIKMKDTENPDYLYGSIWDPIYAITHPWYRIDIILKNNEKKILTYQGIKQGLLIMQENYSDYFNSFLKDNFSHDNGNVFLQCALFEKVIFNV